MLFLLVRLGRIFDKICSVFAQLFWFNVERRLFFADGFGNISAIPEVDAFMHSVANGSIQIPLPLVKKDKEYDESSFKFASPASFFLPETVRMAFFRFIKPPRTMKGIIIILPHTGDEWYDHRTKMMRDLIEDEYAVIIPMAPFYGMRRGPKQNLHFVRSVELYVKAGAAAALETAAIVKWVHKTYPSIKVCVAGVSYGGAIAAYTACIIHEPISIVSFVGTDSGCSWLSGPLATQIAWSAFGRERESVRKELFSIFSTRSVSNMVSHRTASQRDAQLHNAVCISAIDDVFINKKDSDLLRDALRRISHTKVVCVAGGHITSVVFNPARIVVPSIKSAMSAF